MLVLLLAVLLTVPLTALAQTTQRGVRVANKDHVTTVNTTPITNNGQIVGANQGSTVTVTTAAPAAGKVAKVTVTQVTDIPVTSLNVTSAGDATTMDGNAQLQMTATASPTFADNQTVTWSVAPATNSSATASIDANGLLTAGNVIGSVVVTATATNGTETTDDDVTATMTIAITTIQLTASMVKSVSTPTYTGSALTPTLTVKNGLSDLVLDTDYTLECSNNTNAGTNTASYTITAKAGSHYVGSVNGNFSIAKADGSLSLNNTTAVNFTASQGTNSTNATHTATFSGGELAATSATPGNCTVSVNQDTGVVTVTRATNSSFTDTEITVSVSPDGNHNAPASVTFNVSGALAINTDDIGKVIGADGKIYATKAAAEAVAPGNAVAMIAYVGTASDCAHGLAIALADESGKKNYGAAGTACSGKTAVTGGTWRLPSEKDWQYMFIGCGSSESYSAPTAGMSKSYSGLASKLTTAQGDALQTGDIYCSSTEVDSGRAWFVGFYGSNANFYVYNENNVFLVRACLAF